MVPVRLLHPDEIGEGLFPVGVPVIRAGAVEAGVDQDGDVFEGKHEVACRWLERGGPAHSALKSL